MSKSKPKLNLKLNLSSPVAAQPMALGSAIVEDVANEAGPEKTKFKLNDANLQYIHELGAGSGGTVSKVLHLPTQTIMARKVINVIVMDESEREKTEKRILRELKILKRCKSPYIVEFYGSFAHEGDISICMEFMDLGSLDHIYQKVGPIPENIVAKITVPCLRGLAYLYDTEKIVHRDIKPCNILFNSKGEIKIADFGVSKELSNGTMAKTFTGTQGYLAPERVREGRIHSVQSDIWSLGLTMMELALARFPFPPEGQPPLPSIIDLLRYIEEEPSPSLPPGRFSKDFEGFVAQCLIKDPNDRPGPNQLLDHAFCVKVGNDFNLVNWASKVSGLL